MTLITITPMTHTMSWVIGTGKRPIFSQPTLLTPPSYAMVVARPSGGARTFNSCADPVTVAWQGLPGAAGRNSFAGVQSWFCKNQALQPRLAFRKRAGALEVGGGDATSSASLRGMRLGTPTQWGG